MLIHPLEGANRHLLRDLRPTYVIVYDADMKFTREIEVLHAPELSFPVPVLLLTSLDYAHAPHITAHAHVPPHARRRRCTRRVIRACRCVYTS